MTKLYVWYLAEVNEFYLSPCVPAENIKDLPLCIYREEEPILFNCYFIGPL